MDAAMPLIDWEFGARIAAQEVGTAAWLEQRLPHYETQAPSLPMSDNSADFPAEVNCDQCGGLATVKTWQENYQHSPPADDDDPGCKECTIECPNCGTRTQFFGLI
jgi:hypothetical protein